MQDVLIDVSFNIGSLGISRKIFELQFDTSMKKFKSIILSDIKQQYNIEILRNEALNYGLARVNNYNRQLYFVPDHVNVSVLTSGIGSAVANCVVFSHRCRTEFSVNLTRKKIKRRNKLKHQKKLIEYIKKADYSKFINLLNKGIDPNYYLSTTNESPLLQICLMKPQHQEKFLNGLISANAHFDYRNTDGKCAIHYAVACENREAVRLLCNNGSSLHEWDDKCIPAQFYAVDNDITVNFFQFILDFSKDLRMIDGSSNNILHHVVKKGLANHLGVLLKYMNNNMNYTEIANILSSKNVSGNTPIHMCILHNQKTCLLMLSRLKICHSVKNEAGDSALDLATKTCNVEAIKILKDFSDEKNYYEISDFRSKSLTYRQSIQHCLTYANTLRRGKTSVGKVFNSYPPIFRCVKSYTSNTGDDFKVSEGECIVIYLVLMTKVAYGYRVLCNNRNFSWFPSSIIGMNSTKQIQEFQKEHATLANLTIHIPELPIKTQTAPVPIMLFLNLNMNEKNIGCEIGYRKYKISSPNISTLDYASSLYIRNVESDSPADISGLRVGDQLLYIMSNEVSTFNQKTVKSIFKKMLESKPPSHFPTSVIRQISLVILRETEGQGQMFTTDGRNDLISEYNTINSMSPHETLTSNRYDLNPKFYNQPLAIIQANSSIKKFLQNKYLKPLPPLPQLPKITENPASSDKFLAFDMNNSDSSNSLDKLPPPPPEFLK